MTCWWKSDVEDTLDFGGKPPSPGNFKISHTAGGEKRATTSQFISADCDKISPRAPHNYRMAQQRIAYFAVALLLVTPLVAAQTQWVPAKSLLGLTFRSCGCLVLIERPIVFLRSFFFEDDRVPRQTKIVSFAIQSEMISLCAGRHRCSGRYVTLDVYTTEMLTECSLCSTSRPSVHSLRGWLYHSSEWKVSLRNCMMFGAKRQCRKPGRGAAFRILFICCSNVLQPLCDGDNPMLLCSYYQSSPLTQQSMDSRQHMRTPAWNSTQTGQSQVESIWCVGRKPFCHKCMLTDGWQAICKQCCLCRLLRGNAWQLKTEPSLALLAFGTATNWARVESQYKSLLGSIKLHSLTCKICCNHWSPSHWWIICAAVVNGVSILTVPFVNTNVLARLRAASPVAAGSPLASYTMPLAPRSSNSAVDLQVTYSYRTARNKIVLLHCLLKTIFGRTASKGSKWSTNDLWTWIWMACVPPGRCYRPARNHFCPQQHWHWHPRTLIAARNCNDCRAS